MNTKSDQDRVHLQGNSDKNIEDSFIKSIQSSTRSLIDSFRDKTKLLNNCSDLKLLLREGYKKDIAKIAGQKFFGSSKVSFVAIDGTTSQDEHLDMLIFYTGTFGYVGRRTYACISRPYQ